MAPRASRTSVADSRARIELERARNGELVRNVQAAAGAGSISAITAQRCTAAALTFTALGWREEAKRLETSTARGSKGKRDALRGSAAMLEEIVTSLSSLGADLGDEPAPASDAPADPAANCECPPGECPGEPEMATCGAVAAVGMPGTCDRLPHDSATLHRDSRSGTEFPESACAQIDEPPPGESGTEPAPAAEATAKIEQYLAGELDELPPAPVEPPAKERPTVPVVFIDPDPVEAPAPIPAAARVLASPSAPDDVQSAAFAEPGRPAFTGTPLTFADLLRPPPAATAPTHRSISQITEYADCALKYRLSRREQVPEEPAWWFVGGSAFHAAVEEMERAAAAVPPGAPLRWPDVAKVFDLKPFWQTHLNRQISETIASHPGTDMARWRAAAKGAEHFTWWLANGEDMLRAYVEMRAMWESEWEIARCPDGTPVIEKPFSLNVNGVRVDGVIDQVWRHRVSGALRIRDLKAGKSKPDDDLQLKTYAVALFAALGLQAPESETTGDYWQARKAASTSPVPLAPAAVWPEIVYRTVSMDAGERAGIYPPRPSSYCGGCGVAVACPIRALAAA